MNDASGAGSEHAGAPAMRSSVPFGQIPAATGSWLLSNAQDIAIILSVATLCLMRRLQTLDAVNTGGDAATKWEFVRQWFFNNDFRHAEWNHHMTRFGVLVPAYLSQCLLGHGLRAYYAAPLTACVVQVVFVYACGKRLVGRFAGVLSALLLIYTSIMATAGSQLLPDLFTGTYGIVMMYLYLRYADASGRARTTWLVLCALTAFIGYLAKETMVFFYPGMAIAIWLAERNSAHPQARKFLQQLRPLVIFFGCLFVGVALETIAYRVFTNYSSRAGIVVASHLGSGDSDGRPDTTFWKLFDRYLHIDKGWVVAFYIFLPSWWALLGFAKNYRVRALLGVVASFYFFLTFLVRGIHPMLLWQRFMSRYLDPTAPFVELVIAMLVALVVRELWQEALPRWQGQNRFTTYFWVVVLVLCGSLSWSSYSDVKDGQRTFTEQQQMSELANDAYNRNLPIVIRKPRSANRFYARDVMALYAIYIDVRALVRNGELPSFDRAKRVSGALTYLVKTPSSYDTRKVNAMLDAGCALEVRETGPSMRLTQSDPLPPSCEALHARL
jgi:hypothetical protein